MARGLSEPLWLTWKDSPEDAAGVGVGGDVLGILVPALSVFLETH